MFARWGYFVYRRRVPVLALSLLLLALSGIALASGGELRTSGLSGAESTRAGDLIGRELPATTGGGQSFGVVFGGPALRVIDPRVRLAVKAALAPLRADGRVSRVVTPYDAAPAAARSLVSRDGRYALVTVYVKGDFRTARNDYPRLRQLIAPSALRGLEVTATGDIAVASTFNRTLNRDLRRAELVSLPLSLILLLLVFGTVVAALLPLGVGVLSIVGGIGGIYLLTRATDVSQYALNVVTLVGLGVAIDYSLFIVNRFREELAQGAPVPDALARSMATAGRAIAFSGLTVAIGLAGLLFYQGTLLASMGLAGTVVVALAVVYALTFLPAVLALLGPRVDAWRLPLGRVGTEGVWHRLADAVMRRPVLVLAVTIPLLLLAGSPFLSMRLAASSDLGTLPSTTEVSRGGALLQERFANSDATYIPVVVQFPGRPLTYARSGALYDLARRLAALPDVARVESPFNISPALGRADYQRLYDGPRPALPAPLQHALRSSAGAHIAVLYAVTAQPATSDRARAVVRRIRAGRTAGDGTILVAGQTAYDIDSTNRIMADTPAALAFIVGATYLVLFLLLGSVLLPLKAVITDVLSITASFGAMVWVFQQGHLSKALNFTPSSIDPLLPVLLFCIVFGLSMDYEVLLLSRIKEAYERGGDNRAAVAEGLERSGRLVTGAAAIMVVVFSAFALADVSLIKALGLGLAIAVAVDATIVRALVVPATMRLLGGLNWWAPHPLARLHRRLGLAETAGYQQQQQQPSAAGD